MHVCKQFHSLGGWIEGRQGEGGGDWIKKLACQMKHKKEYLNLPQGAEVY